MMQTRLLYAFVQCAILLSMTACGGGGGASSNPSAPISPSISSVSVTCTPSAIAAQSTSQCTAIVQGKGSFSSAVNWSAGAGTINASGLFTAPATAGTVTVTATSTQDTAKSGTASVSVHSAPPTITSVAVTCNPSTITVSATSQCAATIQGTGSYSSAITWSASRGAIAASGLYTAPATPGAVTVTAASIQDTTKTGTASLTVQSTPPTITSVVVTCNPSTIALNATSQCAATVQGTGAYSSAVTWSASGGRVSASGIFTAPASPGSEAVTATSVGDTSKSGTATVVVELLTPQSKHVVIVMEENQSYATVVGDTSGWPNLNNLISNGALATNYYANSHPSIGNYFMLTTGQLLTTDDSSTTVWDVDNLARRMLTSGVSFRVYAEGVTQGYMGGDTGLYVIRHNPFAMLSDVADNPQVANQCIWPFTQFAADLASGAWPEFSFIVPNLDDDAHNGTPLQADAWLQTNVVAPLSTSSAFASGGDGILIVAFDEAVDTDTTNGGGHVAPVLWGPKVKAGYQQTSTTMYQHQSVLRTVTEAFRLANPPGAAASAPSMAEFFVQK